MENDLRVPEGWSIAEYAEPGKDTGKQSKNLELVAPGPQSGEDDYHSQYVDPEGKFGATKTAREEENCSYGGDGKDEMKPEGELPNTPQAPGLQAPLYPKRHSGIMTSY
jgi:hypothetical protein